MLEKEARREVNWNYRWLWVAVFLWPTLFFFFSSESEFKTYEVVLASISAASLASIFIVGCFFVYLLSGFPEKVTAEAKAMRVAYPLFFLIIVVMVTALLPRTDFLPTFVVSTMVAWPAAAAVYYGILYSYERRAKKKSMTWLPFILAGALFAAVAYWVLLPLLSWLKL